VVQISLGTKFGWIDRQQPCHNSC